MCSLGSPVLSDENKAKLIRIAAAEFPKEACGLLFGETVQQITNRATHPTEFFVMDIEEMKQASSLYGIPTGLWHSHPSGNGRPSVSDLEHHPAGLDLVIVTVGEVHEHGAPI